MQIKSQDSPRLGAEAIKRHCPSLPSSLPFDAGAGRDTHRPDTAHRRSSAYLPPSLPTYTASQPAPYKNVPLPPPVSIPTPSSLHLVSIPRPRDENAVSIQTSIALGWFWLLGHSVETMVWVEHRIRNKVLKIWCESKINSSWLVLGPSVETMIWVQRRSNVMGSTVLREPFCHPWTLF